MKIVSVSDLHGNLIDNLPKGDILTISGDLVPADWRHIGTKQQKKWFEREFIPWCETKVLSDHFNHIVFIAGNHDKYLEKIYRYGFEDVFRNKLPERVHYLRDSMITIDDVVFYGTPWTTIFCNWYFMKCEEALFVGPYAEIPTNVDVLLSHGPPMGFGDETVFNPHEHLGSLALLKHIISAKPKYCLFGHIHTGDHSCTIYEETEEHPCRAINVSLLDESYSIRYDPFVFEI